MACAVRAFARVTLLLLAFVPAAREAAAQSCFVPGSSRQAVYFSGPNNSIACVIDFATNTTRTVVNTAGSGTNFTGLNVLYEGEGTGGGLSLVVGSSTQGGEIQVFDCDAFGEACQFRGTPAVFSQVLGLSLNTFGDLAAVNGSAILYVERCTQGDPDPLCVASGYSAPGGPYPVPGLAQPLDVRYVSNAIERSTASSYQPGDVLVLGPSQIVRISAQDLASGLTASSPYALVGPPIPGGQAKGFALFPQTGEIIVTTNAGGLFVLGRTGGSWTAFAGANPLAGRKGVNVAVGNNKQRVSDPANGAEVFVTTNANGTVQRFVAKRSGAALTSSLVADPAYPVQIVTSGNPPYGVANATLTDAAWTPTASSFTINPARGYDISFESTRQSGFSRGRAYLLPECDVLQAGAARGVAPNGAITSTMVGLPDDPDFWRVVPSYVPASCRTTSPTCTVPSSASACPVANPRYYLVYVTDTGADVFGSTQQHHFEEDRQGFAPAPCTAPIGPYVTATTDQARLFYATDHDDPAIVEGRSFIDITSGCGSHVARGDQFSLFVAASDTRPLDEIIRFKLTYFETALYSTNAAGGGLYSYFKQGGLRNSVLKSFKDARDKYFAADYAGSQAALDKIIGTVRGNLAGFKECVSVGTTPYCRNAPGQIIARAVSTAFMVCGADPEEPSCAKYTLP